MDGISASAAVACFAGIVISMVDVLSPSDKFLKQMKIMFALMFILCVVTPIARGDITFDDFAVSASAETELENSSAAGDEYFKRAVERNISRNLEEILSEAGIETEKIETSINISENGGISINVIEAFIKDGDMAETALDALFEASGETAEVYIYMGSETDED
ncbi:MAG: hypothetical protein LBL87_00190 [Ruminococcus sp.]|nr:hypothetical protein [Ruminococcus sp.]